MSFPLNVCHFCINVDDITCVWYNVFLILCICLHWEHYSHGIKLYWLFIIKCIFGKVSIKIDTIKCEVYYKRENENNLSKFFILSRLSYARVIKSNPDAYWWRITLIVISRNTIEGFSSQARHAGVTNECSWKRVSGNNHTFNAAAGSSVGDTPAAVELFLDFTDECDGSASTDRFRVVYSCQTYWPSQLYCVHVRA